jgi:hypothetical protein
MIDIHKISGNPALGPQNRLHVLQQSHDMHMLTAIGGNHT